MAQTTGRCHDLVRRDDRLRLYSLTTIVFAGFVPILGLAYRAPEIAAARRSLLERVSQDSLELAGREHPRHARLEVGSKAECSQRGPLTVRVGR